MADKNVTVNGTDYTGIGKVELNLTTGGVATYVETSDADAIASNISKNKTAYVNGVKITGTREDSGGSGGVGDYSQYEELTGTIDDNGTYLTIAHNLGVKPKFVSISCLESDQPYTDNGYIRNLSIIGSIGCADAINLSSGKYTVVGCAETVKGESFTENGAYFMSDTVVKIRQNSNNAKWSTTATYTVKLYA